MKKINSNSIFEVLDDATLSKLSEKLQKVKLEEGETLFERNESGEDLYAIEEGLLKISIEDPISERNKTLALLGSGEVVGELAILTDHKRSGRATALRPCTLYKIGEKDFLQFLRDYPEMGLQLIKILCKRLLMTDREIQNVTFNTIPERLAAQLIKLSEKFGSKVEEGYEIDIDLTHQRLAELIGTNRETVTRHLSQFENNGRIKMQEDQRIKIVDLESLERMM